jgi:hypothetical protein
MSGQIESMQKSQTRRRAAPLLGLDIVRSSPGFFLQPSISRIDSIGKEYGPRPPHPGSFYSEVAHSVSLACKRDQEAVSDFSRTSSYFYQHHAFHVCRRCTEMKMTRPNPSQQTPLEMVISYEAPATKHLTNPPTPAILSLDDSEPTQKRSDLEEEVEIARLQTTLDQL